jgi:inward rectifier potassium channel
MPKQRKFAKVNLRRRSRRIRIENRDGKLLVPDLGKWYAYWGDPYHFMLTIPWWGYVAIVAIAYVLLNSIFALAYLAGGDCLENARPGNFLDAFFFSVQTFASIGYGAIYPKTTYANWIVTIEAISSLLAIAVVTGIAFARFSNPPARIRFSKHAVITSYDGRETLMFRLANERLNVILEAEIKAYLLLDEITKEGEFVRRFYPLNLVRDRTPTLTLSWTVMHAIDAESPFANISIERLQQAQGQIIISLSGIDETIAYAIHTRHIYGSNDILFDYRFRDIIVRSDNGDRFIDFAHFHDVEPQP